MKLLKLFVAAVTGLVAASVQAVVMLVTTPAALGANDLIDWTQLGPPHTLLFGPQSVISSGGVSVTATSASDILDRVNQGLLSGFLGNFAAGTPLLYTTVIGGPDITLNFATPIYGAGAQIQSDDYGPFTAQITGVGGHVLGTFTGSGISNGNADNSAIFLGILSDTANITSIIFTIPTAGAGPNSFAIGPVSLNTNGTTAISEPATLSLFGLGLLGFAAFRRKMAKDGSL